MRYYLTVVKDREEIVSRLPFDDYADAIQFTSRYYQPRIPGTRATLELVTQILNGSFVRSYGSLMSPGDLGDDPPAGMVIKPAKQENAFVYEGSYLFLIESDVGVLDSDALRKEDDQDQ